MQALHIRFLRHHTVIKVTCYSGTMQFPYDPDLSPQQNAQHAATLFASLWSWKGDWSLGQLPDGSYAATKANLTFTVGTTTMQEKLSDEILPIERPDLRQR